jgi:hypothetical protein
VGKKEITNTIYCTIYVCGCSNNQPCRLVIHRGVVLGKASAVGAAAVLWCWCVASSEATSRQSIGVSESRPTCRARRGTVLRTGFRVLCSLKRSSRSADCSLVSLSFFRVLPSSSSSSAPAPAPARGNAAVDDARSPSASSTRSLFTPATDSDDTLCEAPPPPDPVPVAVAVASSGKLSVSDGSSGCGDGSRTSLLSRRLIPPWRTAPEAPPLPLPRDRPSARPASSRWTSS